ncbi:hypothetical protein JL720_4119 [Aureococcus anophagefferens]|nr:hypothetical protein JL720_4119 [Aureococcus anophagefferens]
MMRVALLALLATSSALRWPGAAPKGAVRGGSEGTKDGDLFEEDAAPELSEEEQATKRYADAVAAAKAQGGACAALDAFEAESLKPDRNESLLAVHWMDVKLQNLQAKKDQLAGNATTPEPGLLGRMKGAFRFETSGFDEAAPYAKGVFLLATECGAYVEAEKLSERSFCERCAAALGVDDETFADAHKRFEVALGKEVLEMIKDEATLEAMRTEMLEKLVEADGNAYAQAALCKQLTPAVDTMLGAPLEQSASA